MHFYKKLPKVSIIIPFYDEHPTTIMRTVHSIINRTPPQLLKEIILVNDASTHKDLFRILTHHFIAQPWASKIKIFMMKERAGPNWSRMAGARSASGDVLLFLDCHVEVGYNYLPPLLNPIVKNFRAVVTPTLDIIDKHTYEMRPLGVGRTVFDWNFHGKMQAISQFIFN
jgi:polypeptide N-acetylgalactosaminyltransferase